MGGRVSLDRTAQAADVGSISKPLEDEAVVVSSSTAKPKTRSLWVAWHYTYQTFVSKSRQCPKYLITMKFRIGKLMYKGSRRTRFNLVGKPQPTY
jgi:hypothetical protein